MSEAPLRRAPPSDFLSKFKDKISVVGKDGGTQRLDGQPNGGESSSRTVGGVGGGGLPSSERRRPASHEANQANETKSSSVAVMRRRPTASDLRHADPPKRPPAEIAPQNTQNIARHGRRRESPRFAPQTNSWLERSPVKSPQSPRNGYAAKGEYAQKKTRELSDFRPYSYADYERIQPKEYVELGGLGPDLNNEELLVKKEKRDRAKAYAEEIRQNMPAPTRPRPVVRDEPKPVSARDKALEFARNIPKPSLRPTKPSSAPESTGDRDMLHREPATRMASTELEQLQARHNIDREKVQQIRHELGL
eukprot:CAMPEP_0175912832 /NCGR_PEP_ID=MMETSP0108-20121206/8942_1 /TAXON_ID=195067 ORGANISM="Goniomonas pacifica, Strain CCMP1869" /NCGR_SAMPLE_ID=MMETSP0108 /ASSEMBLY_ACC=CAM_ASM_000204 /LENGTH=306 /DNA_ID=CAMNT_0017235181 /DNA_START=38 /DNA_END=958 /DNA_ORIENTATION=+